VIVERVLTKVPASLEVMLGEELTASELFANRLTELRIVWILLLVVVELIAVTI
jgi:hypothetical protein